MGIALAGEAVRRGAAVTLVLGPTSLDVGRGMECVRVQTAAEMLQAALSAFQTADAAICAAAVADYTPAAPADHKLKKATNAWIASNWSRPLIFWLSSRARRASAV